MGLTVPYLVFLCFDLKTGTEKGTTIPLWFVFVCLPGLNVYHLLLPSPNLAYFCSSVVNNSPVSCCFVAMVTTAEYHLRFTVSPPLRESPAVQGCVTRPFSSGGQLKGTHINIALINGPWLNYRYTFSADPCMVCN